MTWTQHFLLFTASDFLGLFLIFGAWVLIGALIERASDKRPSMSLLMVQHRIDWMQEMARRENRIFDSQIMNNLRQGTAFFTSATMITVGGLLALLGNADALANVAQDLTLDQRPTIVWEFKLLVTLTFVTNAFLKFVWSHRLFGYATIVMASVPNDPKNDKAQMRADTAAQIMISAAKSYNRGLRSIYFGLGSASWALGPLALIAAAIITFAVLYRREFLSKSRAVLMADAAACNDPSKQS
jgi:uncharacterized membrane protein